MQLLIWIRLWPNSDLDCCVPDNPPRTGCRQSVSIVTYSAFVLYKRRTVYMLRCQMMNGSMFLYIDASLNGIVFDLPLSSY